MAKPKVPRDRFLSPELRTFLEDLGTWRDFTPTVSSGTGTLTDASATGRYTQIGTTIAFQAKITVTTNGTGASNIVLVLPVESTSDIIVTGQEISATGGVLVGAATTALPSNLIITFTDGTYPAGDGYVLVLNGVYEGV